MKKIVGLLSFVLVLLAMACSSKPAEVKKEVIVVPASPPAPIIVVKDPPVKSTTVTLDKNGVKVATKKVNVVIKKDNK